MKFHCFNVIIASLVFSTLYSPATAQDQKTAVLACYDEEVAALISSKNRPYSSPQFRIVCQYRDISKREQNKTFTYIPPENFKIVSTDVEVVLKSSRAKINDLTFQGQHATVKLHCKGRPDDELVHDAIAVKVFGRLEYLPTHQDTKVIIGKCLNQAKVR